MVVSNPRDTSNVLLSTPTVNNLISLALSSVVNGPFLVGQKVSVDTNNFAYIRYVDGSTILVSSPVGSINALDTITAVGGRSATVDTVTPRPLKVSGEVIVREQRTLIEKDETETLSLLFRLSF